MNHTILFVILSSLGIVSIGLLLGYLHLSRVYDEIDDILSSILSREQEASIRLMEEKRISKLAHKALRIGKMTNAAILRTKEEKETVQSFISDMSHQMKTPLSSILMYTDLLTEGNLCAKEQTEFFSRLKSSASKLEWMMDKLVDISRLEVGVLDLKPKNNSLMPTLRDAINSVHASAEKKNIDIFTHEFADVCLVHDRKWTAEALTNILENAIKYSHSGTEIRIAVEPLAIYTKISITDSGIGIDSAEWNDIFGRFYRGKNATETEGVGIGLYLVRLILEKQNGYIMVDSVVGQGTTFSVFLQNCNE